MGEGLFTREIERARKAVEGGRAKVSGRWHSARWWAGHHLSPVDECGAFSTWEEAEECHNGSRARGRGGFTATTATIRQRRAARTPRAQAERDAFDAYLEERYTAADAATGGRFLSKRGQRRRTDPRRFFTRGSVNPADAADELRDWFRQEGPVMTLEEWREAQVTGRSSVSGVGSWWDRDATRRDVARIETRLGAARSTRRAS